MDTAKPEIDLLPFNVWSRSEEEIGRLTSNFAHTPFELDGVAYASFEGFYGLAVVPRSGQAPQALAALWPGRQSHRQEIKNQEGQA